MCRVYKHARPNTNQLINQPTNQLTNPRANPPKHRPTQAAAAAATTAAAPEAEGDWQGGVEADLEKLTLAALDEDEEEAEAPKVADKPGVGGWVGGVFYMCCTFKTPTDRVNPLNQYIHISIYQTNNRSSLSLTSRKPRRSPRSSSSVCRGRRRG